MGVSVLYMACVHTHTHTASGAAVKYDQHHFYALSIITMDEDTPILCLVHYLPTGTHARTV